MEVVLEPIETENAGDEIASTDVDDRLPPAAPLAPSMPLPESKLQDIPVKRPRGRPKGKAAAKAPAPKKAPVRVASPRRKAPVRRPPSSSSDSSSDDEQSRGAAAAVHRLMHDDDMETQVLKFLNARKQTQVQKRNVLWKQLALHGLGR